MDDEAITDLRAIIGAIGHLTTQTLAILHRIAPEEFEDLLRTQRLLVQATEAGRFQIGENPLGQRSHRLALDFLEQAAAETD